MGAFSGFVGPPLQKREEKPLFSYGLSDLYSPGGSCELFGAEHYDRIDRHKKPSRFFFSALITGVKPVSLPGIWENRKAAAGFLEWFHVIKHVCWWNRFKRRAVYMIILMHTCFPGEFYFQPVNVRGFAFCRFAFYISVQREDTSQTHFLALRNRRLICLDTIWCILSSFRFMISVKFTSWRNSIRFSAESFFVRSSRDLMDF